MSPLVSASHLHRYFKRGSEVIHAVLDVTFDVAPGEVIAIMGPSGSGKSTLLNILSGWEHPDSGTVAWKGDSGMSMLDMGWSEIGLIPQRLGLLEDLSVQENVELPLILLNKAEAEAQTVAEGVMQELDIAHLGPKLPTECSLGEQQRVCIARALVAAPTLILADEPTGNQDHRREAAIFAALRVRADQGSACLIATHDPRALTHCTRVIRMHDGELVTDERTSRAAGGPDERWRR